MSREPFDRMIKMIFILLKRMESLLEQATKEGDLQPGGGDIKLRRTGSGGMVNVSYSEEEAGEQVQRSPDGEKGEKGEDETPSAAELALKRFEERKEEADG